MSSNLKSCSFSKVRANPLARHFFRHRTCSLRCEVVTTGVKTETDSEDWDKKDRRQ